MSMLIKIDRQVIELGDRFEVTEQDLRAFVDIPGDREIWYENGYTGIDEKIEGTKRAYLGSDYGPPRQFRTAPRVIG